MGIFKKKRGSEEKLVLLDEKWAIVERKPESFCGNIGTFWRKIGISWVKLGLFKEKLVLWRKVGTLLSLPQKCQNSDQNLEFWPFERIGQNYGMIWLQYMNKIFIYFSAAEPYVIFKICIEVYHLKIKIQAK